MFQCLCSTQTMETHPTVQVQSVVIRLESVTEIGWCVEIVETTVFWSSQRTVSHVHPLPYHHRPLYLRPLSVSSTGRSHPHKCSCGLKWTEISRWLKSLVELKVFVNSLRKYSTTPRRSTAVLGYLKPKNNNHTKANISVQPLLTPLSRMSV